jgi:hypothetical protein
MLCSPALIFVRATSSPRFLLDYSVFIAVRREFSRSLFSSAGACSPLGFFFAPGIDLVAAGL